MTYKTFGPYTRKSQSLIPYIRKFKSLTILKKKHLVQSFQYKKCDSSIPKYSYPHSEYIKNEFCPYPTGKP